MPESEFDDMIQDSELTAQELDLELQRIRDQRIVLDQRMNELWKQREDARRAVEEARRKKEEEERKKREEEEALARAALLNRPTEIRVCDFHEMMVNIKVLPDIRPDILEDMRGIWGRQYDAYAGVNRIPIKSWNLLREKFEARPNVKVVELLDANAKLHAYYKGPEFHISLLERVLKVVPHVDSHTSVIHQLPGAQWFSEKKFYHVPISEGWRLWNDLEHYHRDGMNPIKWEPDALAIVQSELERRAKLDAVALRSDSDIKIDLNGRVLHPFQKVGVEFLTLAKGRALLADQMGLGKTWQAIAYAVHHNLRTVIICPAHLKTNWSREITALTGKPPAVMYGREPDDYAIKTFLIDKPQFTVINYDIIASKVMTLEEETVDDQGRKHIVPPRPRWLWAELIRLANPDFIVTDEAHYFKNSETSRWKAISQLKSEHRLPMTGTPIINRPGEAWTLLHWVRPELFPSEERFLMQYTANNGKTARNVQQLRELLKPIMLRRLKKEVVSELPPINRITRYHELTPEAAEDYKKVLAGVYKAIDEAGNQIHKNITNLLVELGKLKEVCAHDTVEDTAELATELYDTEMDAEDPKLGRKKVLIFSQYKDVVRKIIARLGNEAIGWTGDTPMEERTRLEQEFQNNPDVHFLVVSLMTGQTGLNLTAAGHIVFNDLYWTPASHAQAEERAYGRLNDLHGADSYYIVTVNTIVEWIQELLQSKLAVINSVVEGIDAERDPSIGMEIIRRLQEARGMLR